MPLGFILERCNHLIGYILPDYVQRIFCSCLPRRSRGHESVRHSSEDSVDSRQKKYEEDRTVNRITPTLRKYTEFHDVGTSSSAGPSECSSSSDSLTCVMNSTERANNGHGKEAYAAYNNTRRYTEPYRPARSSQASPDTTYRSLSNVSQYRRTNELATEEMRSRRQNVSPDLSLSSNSDAMNITSNGSISPASSTFTLSSQIGNHDYDFTVARLRFVLDYTLHMSKLTATISKVELTDESMIKDKEGMEIDLVLLPDKRQSFRIKSKHFTEPQAFYIYPRERLTQMRLRFRLYENQRMLRRVLLAEGVFALKNVRLGFELITLDIEMFPPTRGLVYRHRMRRQVERSMSPVSEVTDSSCISGISQEPELLVSLQHRPSVQRLNIEILKTRCCGEVVHHKTTSMYVEIKLISSLGDLLFDTKTSVRRDSSSPEFNEKFSFFLPDNNLLSVTLLVTLLRVSRPFGRKSLVGRFSIGRNNSDKSEELHWSEVVCGQDCGPILKWHKMFRL